MALKLTLDGQSISFSNNEIDQVGAGGEGSVFLLSNSGQTFAIKRYHQPSKERFEKVRATIAARPINAIYSNGNSKIVQMAWPLGIVQENGRDVGFAMPYVSPQETLDLDFFINPILAKDRRHVELPNLAVRLQIAQNLCSIVKSLHDNGHYFIDFKPANVKVYPKSRHVCLIDCDSYSISYQGRRFPATAYSPQFINPLALVNNLHPSKLGEEQDNWAIAVALFQLLNFDLHPYDGVASGSIVATATDDFVKMGLYAYGFKLNPLVAPKPKSVHTMWPVELRQLFDRAFTDSQNAPQMSVWIDCLKDILENNKLERCNKFPGSVDHLKFLKFDCMQCSFESRQKKKAPQKAKSISKPKVDTNTILRPSTTPVYTPPKKNFYTFDKIFWGIVGAMVLYSVFINVNEKSNNSNSQSVQNPPETTKSADATLNQLAKRKREETFAFEGRYLRVPDNTSQLNLEELRWCAYEGFRLAHFLKGDGVGRISDKLLQSQREDYYSLCWQDQNTKKVYSPAWEDIVNQELSDEGIKARLKTLLNLR